MAGKKGRSGAHKRRVMTKVVRISLGPQDGDLLPFFKELAGLPACRRNEALLTAVRRGVSAAQTALARRESARAAKVIDCILSEFDS